MLKSSSQTPTAAPHCRSHCQQLRVCLTLQFLWRQAIDWVGLWNEHWQSPHTMFTYAKTLRRQLDEAGLQATKIIGPDAFPGPALALCEGMLADPELSAAVRAIGVHGAIPTACVKTGVPLFQSEDGSTYGDTAGGLQRVHLGC